MKLASSVDFFPRMNRKFALTLLSSPALFASIISMVVMMQPAQANPAKGSQNQLSCVRSPHSAVPRFVCERRQNSAVTAKLEVDIAQVDPSKITQLEFTDEESDAAIALFGCDCPSCINALRQLHGLSQVPV